MPSVHDRMTHEERRLRRAEMAEMVRSGAKFGEVASRFGCSRATVGDACCENDVLPAQGRSNGLSRSTYHVLAALQNTDESTRSIADRFRISQQRVHEILTVARNAGIKFPNR